MGKVTKFTVEKIPKSALTGGDKHKINLQDKYDDGLMDLSMCDLQDVPVKDIMAYPKTYSLDLSSNHITLLPSNFIALSNIIKLDLSKNELQELPANFGDLVKLKHLDLYRNKLQHLPLSFSKLTNLKWLDLKDNPLVPKVAEVAGPCLDNRECQSCAKNIVNFYVKLEMQIEEERKMRERHRQQSLQANLTSEKKKEVKKKKEKVNSDESKNSYLPEDDVGESSSKVCVVKKKLPSLKPRKQPKRSFFLLLISSFLWLMGLSLFTMFIFTSIDNSNANNVREIVRENWYKCVNSLPENLQPTAVWCGTNFNHLHVFIGSHLSKVMNIINEYRK